MLASRADGAAGAPGDGVAIDLALDADGSRVAFSTTAANLGDGDADSDFDVHVRDFAAGRTLLASRAPGTDGAKADANAVGVDIDASGTRISFVSRAANLPGAGAFTQAYVRDLTAGTTTHVSTLAPEFGTNVGATQASIDAAGRRVAYTSPAPLSLAPGDPVSIVLVRDLETGTIRLASRDDDGTPADGNAADAQISPDGDIVAFTSIAPLAGSPGDGVARVFRRDLAAGRTALVSRRTGAAGAPVARQARTGTVSDGGRCVSFSTSDPIAGPPASHRESFLRTFADDCAAPGPAGPGGPGAGPGGGPGGGGLQPLDTTAPVLSRVRLDRSRLRGRRAVVLRFRTSEAATLRVVAKRRRDGRFVRAGVLRRPVAAGAGRVRLTRRIGGRRLLPGRYRLVVTAADAAGNRSTPRRLRLAVASRRT
jgi:hypothetical protein